jgi:hypothetical protein
MHIQNEKLITHNLENQLTLIYIADNEYNLSIIS